MATASFTCAILAGLGPQMAALALAQEAQRESEVRRTVRYEYRLINPADEALVDIAVVVPLPHECERQDIHYLRHVGRGRARQFADCHGQRLIEYRLDRLECGEVADFGFVTGVTLRDRKWEVSGGGVAETVPAIDRRRYLESRSKYSMRSELMRDTARAVVGGASSEFEKLERLHDHVVDRMRYVRDGRWDSAAECLERGSGSCSEFSYVLSGLCRLAELPTRLVGGTSSRHRALPYTDLVFHRWTEVWLEGVGWYPVDCSRDSDPAFGRRSHFGRVHSDALVWSRQAGGGDDALRWEYRARWRTRSGPGPIGRHRARWFEFVPESTIEAAAAWIESGGGREEPAGDALECATLGLANIQARARERVVDALARAERTEAIRLAAPLSSKRRARAMQRMFLDADLARAVTRIAAKSVRLESWFRRNELRLGPAGGGRFELRSGGSTGRTGESAAGRRNR